VSDRIRIQGAPPTASHAMTAWLAAFPEPGEYIVAKAEVAGIELGEFETWFLRRLYDVTRERFVTSQYAVWEVLDDLLRRRGVAAPSELDWWELNRTLFDVSTASTARLVGLRIPSGVRESLTQLGFAPPEILDFPGVAYRMGAIYQRLEAHDPMEWRELLELAKEVPLSPAEELAAEFARDRLLGDLQSPQDLEQDRPLSLQHFAERQRPGEPGRAIDLGKLLASAGSRRPFQGEQVALDRGRRPAPARSPRHGSAFRRAA